MTRKISELTLKSTPELTDEFELQETGDGNSRKVTLQGIRDALLNLTDEVATTSGSSAEISIPSGARRVTLMLAGVSSSSTGNLAMTLNSATSLYRSVNSFFTASAVSTSTSTSDYILTAGSAAADGHYGTVILSLQDEPNNLWVIEHAVANDNATEVSMGAGSKTVSGGLSTIQVTVSSGSFDAGSISALVE